MISIVKTYTIVNENDKKVITGELRGKSTDTKPTKIGESEVGNGSTYVEIDTGKIFFYDADSKTWKEI